MLKANIEVKMTRTEFLKLLAKFIEQELNDNLEKIQSVEPYRAAGDRLIDDALEYID